MLRRGKGRRIRKGLAKLLLNPGSFVLMMISMGILFIILFVVYSGAIIGAAGYFVDKGYSYDGGGTSGVGIGFYAGGSRGGEGVLPLLDDGERFYFPIVATCVTSNFGRRVHPVTGKRGSMHYGIDLGVGRGSETFVYPARPGKVVKVNRYSGGRLPRSIAERDPLRNTNIGGQYVVIEHDIRGNKMYTVYMHLYRVLVKEGDRVGMGNKIGIVGNTGRSTGPHLHFEVRYTLRGGQINPANVLYCGGKKVKKGVNLNECFGFRE